MITPHNPGGKIIFLKAGKHGNNYKMLESKIAKINARNNKQPKHFLVYCWKAKVTAPPTASPTTFWIHTKWMLSDDILYEVQFTFPPPAPHLHLLLFL